MADLVCAGLVWRTVFSCQEDAGHPGGMRQTGLQEISRFTFHVVLNPANGDAVTVNQQVGSAAISIVGLADAAGIGYGHVFQAAYVRTMDVSVDHDRSVKRSVCALQLGVAGVRHRGTPEIIRAGVNQA